MSALEMQEKESPKNATTENELTRHLLKEQRHPDFPHVIAVEWFHDPPFSQNGKGDVVFANSPFLSHPQTMLFDPNCSQPALKVLIVEVKAVSGSKKGQKRRYVGKQLVKSMEAWRKKRPEDEVWGCTYTDEKRNWWCDISSLDNIQIQQPLTIELVPEGVWGNRFKPFIPLQLWRNILAEHKITTNNKCEKCGWQEENGDQKKLVLHQRWMTLLADNSSKSSCFLFLGFELLCWDCHDCKHAGWANAEGRADTMKNHLMNMNQWTRDQVDQEEEAIFGKWRYESKTYKHWIVEHKAFDNLPQVKQWKLDHPNDIFRFGSLCMRREVQYNKNPQRLTQD